jgi:hypothetical protein
MSDGITTGTHIIYQVGTASRPGTQLLRFTPSIWLFRNFRRDPALACWPLAYPLDPGRVAAG